MPNEDQAETARGPEASFFYDSARQLVNEYGYAMPGGTANIANHTVFPDSFTEQNIAGVLGRFQETGRLGSISSIAGVSLLLDATKAPDLYLWRFWLNDCRLDPRSEDTGMVELVACLPHGYVVFARPDSATAYYQDHLTLKEGFGVDVTEAVWVLGSLTSHVLANPYVKNRLNQMLLNRIEREQHLIEEGVPLDGDPYKLPLHLGQVSSLRLLEYQQGFLSMIGYSNEIITEPPDLPKLADLSTVPMVLSGLHRSLALDLATS